MAAKKKKKKGGGFTYHNSPNSEMHFVLSEDLIIHPAAKQHSLTHAENEKSILKLQKKKSQSERQTELAAIITIYL